MQKKSTPLVLYPSHSHSKRKICEWKTLLIENSCGCYGDRGKRESNMLSECWTERNAPLKYFAFSATERRRREQPKEALIVRVMQRPEKEVNKLKLPLVFALLLPLYCSTVSCEKYVLEEAARPGKQAQQAGRQALRVFTGGIK